MNDMDCHESHNFEQKQIIFIHTGVSAMLRHARLVAVSTALPVASEVRYTGLGGGKPLKRLTPLASRITGLKAGVNETLSVANADRLCIVSILDAEILHQDLWLPDE
jgi:hypothetical protein